MIAREFNFLPNDYTPDNSVVIDLDSTNEGYPATPVRPTHPPKVPPQPQLPPKQSPAHTSRHSMPGYPEPPPKPAHTHGVHKPDVIPLNKDKG
jgi:hypothetical protein